MLVTVEILREEVEEITSLSQQFVEGAVQEYAHIGGSIEVIKDSYKEIKSTTISGCCVLQRGKTEACPNKASRNGNLDRNETSEFSKPYSITVLAIFKRCRIAIKSGREKVVAIFKRCRIAIKSGREKVATTNLQVGL
ncbi:hypothetical protein QE152_g13511 [Popillia japonica]|uniref:Uncharacterized protein n=1 Tax=Popillia japonica TaxID=7064 RepID=A0AAW1LCH3_POPJA